MASENAHVDVRIETSDPSALERIEVTLRELAPHRLEPHRDVGAILSIATEAAELTSALIVLWKQLRGRPDAAAVTVEAASGTELDLNAVDSEDQIRTFVAAA